MVHCWVKVHVGFISLDFITSWSDPNLIFIRPYYRLILISYFFCNTSAQGGCCYLPFRYKMPSLYLLPMYSYGSSLSINTKIGTNQRSVPTKIGRYSECALSMGQKCFLLKKKKKKIVEACYFHQSLADLNFMGFHQTPRPELWGLPLSMPYSPIFIYFCGKGRAKGTEMIRWNQFLLLVLRKKKAS